MIHFNIWKGKLERETVPLYTNIAINVSPEKNPILPVKYLLEQKVMLHNIKGSWEGKMSITEIFRLDLKFAYLELLMLY